MNIAIVDDEQREIDALSALIKEYSAINRQDLILDTFHSGEELIREYHPYAYTAVFMDVYMGRMNGVSAAEEVLSVDPGAVIVFLTSSDDHISAAFHLHVFDYIAKPADRQKIFSVMDDILLRQTILTSVPKLEFICGKQSVSISYNDIAAVRTSAHNYLEIDDIRGDSYETRLTFSAVSTELLSDPRFLQVLRGVIVNMEHITEINEDSCTLGDRLHLAISTRRAKEFETTWQNFRIRRIRDEKRERRKRR